MNRVILTRLAIAALIIITGLTLRIAYEYTTPAQAQELDPAPKTQSPPRQHLRLQRPHPRHLCRLPKRNRNVAHSWQLVGLSLALYRLCQTVAVPQRIRSNKLEPATPSLNYEQIVEYDREFPRTARHLLLHGTV